MNISLSNWWSWGILLLLLMIVAVVDSRKRISRKISIFILVPVLSVVIIFMMSENNKEAEQSFHTLEEQPMMIGQMSWRHYEEKLQHWLLWMMEM